MQRLPGGKRVPPSAIQFIANNGRARMTQMHPNLVGAPSMQAAFDQAYDATFEPALGEPAERGAGRTPGLTVDHGHTDSLRRISTDRFIHLRPFGHHALHQRKVAAPHRTLGQLVGQPCHRGFAFRHHHQAARVLVQAMNDARTRQCGLGPEAVKKSVQQRARPIPGSRMHHQTSPLVDNQQIPIFMDHLELDRLGGKCRVGLERLGLHQQGFDTDQSVPPAEHALIPADRAQFDPALQSRARELRQALREETVKPLACGARRRQFEQVCARFRRARLRRGCRRSEHTARRVCLGYNALMIRHLLQSARLLGLCVMLTVAGCGTLDQPDETVGWPPDRLYSEASRELERRSWGEAIKLLEKLESRYPFGRWAEQAQLQIAYAHYRNNERVLAIAALDRFMKLHPNHAAFDYALYMKGVVNFNEQEGLFAALGGQDLAERDLQGARDAFDAFRTLTTRFPNSKYAADAEARMVYLIDAMAAGELAVARYYFRRGAYVAAANRAQNIIRQFPTARPTEQALIMLADSYDKLGMPDLRDDTRRVLLNTFPKAATSAAPVQGSRWQFWR
jgi:outer membrane protein assembly factor BamD